MNEDREVDNNDNESVEDTTCEVTSHDQRPPLTHLALAINFTTHSTRWGIFYDRRVLTFRGGTVMNKLHVSDSAKYASTCHVIVTPPPASKMYAKVSQNSGTMFSRGVLFRQRSPSPGSSRDLTRSPADPPRRCTQSGRRADVGRRGGSATVTASDHLHLRVISNLRLDDNGQHTHGSARLGSASCADD